MESKVILLTGASSGIGFQTAEHLAKQGHKVYGAARRVEQMEALKPLGVVPLMLDLTQEASIAEAVAHVIAREKRIDVLINNAGYGLLGAVEDVELSEARKQFEVNVFGLAAITKAVLPYMRAQLSISLRLRVAFLCLFGHGTPPLNIRLRLLAMPCAWRLPAKEYTLR